MFESTTPFTLFDYFRVPYQLEEDGQAGQTGVAALAVRSEAATLSWPAQPWPAEESSRPGAYLIGSIRLFGHLTPDARVRLWLRRAGGDWRPLYHVRDEQGTLVGAVWQRDDGSLFLPFDSNELIRNFWNEAYLQYVRAPVMSTMSSLARRTYYRARPLLPRNVQIGVRRRFTRVQSRSSFPRWPIEASLHDFYDFLFTLVAGLGDTPVPFIGAWPGDRAWALVLTHDVEGPTGYENLRTLLDLEIEAGYRSSWNLVPQNRYLVPRDLVRELREEGFEVGVHGLYHDGRDVSSPAKLRRRLPAIRVYAERWGAKGFRSPGTLRSAKLMPRLGFDYDSSFSDTAPFEPQPGGCCSWLPYMLDDLVELPITLVQDHTLFDLLKHRDERLWIEKTRFLRERGGMALALTHSDYVANPYLVSSYRRLLEEFASDSSAWKALPREVSDWWRRRAASRLDRVDGGWRVIGPAEDEARIEFAAPHALPV